MTRGPIGLLPNDRPAVVLARDRTMIHRPKVLFVVADGAHARLVARSHETGDFIAIQTLDGDDQLRARRREVRSQPSGRSFESASPTRHAVGKGDPYFEVKIAFVATVAEAAIEADAAGGYQGIAVIAPA